MEKRESGFQKVLNTVVSIICVTALMLVCSEPAEGTSFNDWFLWEVVMLVIFVLCAIYLNKHLPNDKDKA